MALRPMKGLMRSQKYLLLYATTATFILCYRCLLILQQNKKTHKVDDEIFDDTDFYQTLLKDLLDSTATQTTDPIAMSQQWLRVHSRTAPLRTLIMCRPHPIMTRCRRIKIA
jgi:hypothetical protein